MTSKSDRLPLPAQQRRRRWQRLALCGGAWLLIASPLAAQPGVKPVHEAAGQTRPQPESSGSGHSSDEETHKRHEYASLRKARVEVVDFEMPTLAGTPVQLRELIEDAKVVLIHFFATFCHNSNYDVRTINDLYRAWREQGLVVIGVCEYSSATQLRRFQERHRPEYPIVLEGEGLRSDREQTLHYRYRRQAGDSRHWGTPFNLFLEKWSSDKKKTVLTRKVKVATGELIRAEVEALLRRRLGEPRAEKSNEPLPDSSAEGAAN